MHILCHPSDLGSKNVRNAACYPTARPSTPHIISTLKDLTSPAAKSYFLAA
jgi:hypothetical protein